MERYQNLCKLLSSSKINKIEFLEELICLTICPGEILENQETVYAKAILYITC